MVSDQEKIKTLIEDISLLENYIQDLFAFSPLPLCFINPKGVILEVNPAFVKVTGHDEYDIVGEQLNIILDDALAKAIIKDVLEKEVIERTETKLKTKSGEDIPIVVFAKSRRIKDGAINGAFLSFFDLTEVKKKEEEVRKSRVELEEKIEAMERFNKLTIGREMKMVELKEKIIQLEKELKKYKK